MSRSTRPGMRALEELARQDEQTVVEGPPLSPAELQAAKARIAERQRDEEMDMTYARLFSTPDGLRVIAELKERFCDGPLYYEHSSRLTERAVSMRDVVEYIRERVREGKKHV